MPLNLPNDHRLHRALPRAICASALGALVLSTACQAPGMKFTPQSSSQPETTEMGNLKVTLRRLDPDALKSLENRQANTAALGELLSDHVDPYVIGAQDILLVTVWDHPEITLALGQYRTDTATGTIVDDDGYMFFPYVGRVLVKGLTTPQVRTKLTADLAKVLQNPQVDVKVIAYRSQKIFVGGEVKSPAVYNVTDIPFTLAEAVNRAGGFNLAADDSRISLTRGSRTWILDFQALMAQGNQIGKIYLKDGDSLQVPNAQEAPVYMMGEVEKPAAVPLMHGNLSLAKAISDVGGLSGTTSDARSVYVIRQGRVANAVDVYHLDARNPTAMILADRFPLQARDIVYVDAGTKVRFSRVMNLLLPTVSAVTGAATAAAEIKYWGR